MGRVSDSGSPTGGMMFMAAMFFGLLLLARMNGCLAVVVKAGEPATWTK